MKRFSITAPGEFKFSDKMYKPKPKENEVLLKVLKIGYCGSDLKTFRGENPMVNYPRIPGHEIVGEVVEVGSKVFMDCRVGDIATVLPYTNCGSCMACAVDRTNACEFNETLGVQRNGALTEYICVPYNKLLTDLNHLDQKHVALIEPLSVGFHATYRGKIKEDDFVVVFGCGLIGMGAIISASQKGARVIAVDLDDEKLNTAKEFGAEFTVNAANKNSQDEIMLLTKGNGARVCIEAIGNPVTFQEAVDVTCFCGTVVYVGYVNDPVEYETKYFVMKELDIRGSRNANYEDFIDVINVMERSTLPFSKLVTQEYSFEEAGKALEFWNENPNKVTKILINM